MHSIKAAGTVWNSAAKNAPSGIASLQALPPPKTTPKGLGIVTRPTPTRLANLRLSRVSPRNTKDPGGAKLERMLEGADPSRTPKALRLGPMARRAREQTKEDRPENRHVGRLGRRAATPRSTGRMYRMIRNATITSPQWPQDAPRTGMSSSATYNERRASRTSNFLLPNGSPRMEASYRD